MIEIVGMCAMFLALGFKIGWYVGLNYKHTESTKSTDQ